jgi:hypothetical protein
MSLHVDNHRDNKRKRRDMMVVMRGNSNKKVDEQRRHTD